MACAPLRRATLRAAHAALRRAAGSAHGARLVTSQAHDLTSACSCPAVPWAAPAPSSVRVAVVSGVRRLPDPPTLLAIRRGTANSRRRVNRLAGGLS